MIESINTIDRIKSSAKLIRQGLEQLNKGPLDYYLTKLAIAYDKLLTFAPYQVNDRVELINIPILHEMTEDFKWYHYRQFIHNKAVGTVKNIDISCDTGDFEYSVTFDLESYTDQFSKKLVFVDQRHSFVIEPFYLKKHDFQTL